MILIRILDNWPFTDPPNVATVTVRQIVREGHPILIVVRDEQDGGWQFLSGGSFHVEDSMVVALKTMVQLDPTLLSLADLPLGWEAWRETKEHPWVRRRGTNDDF